MIRINPENLGFLLMDQGCHRGEITLLQLLGKNLIVLQMPSLNQVLPSSKVPGLKPPKVGLKVME